MLWLLWIAAIYWAQKYPDEIEAIIGLDMAVPEYYENMKINVPLIQSKLEGRSHRGRVSWISVSKKYLAGFEGEIHLKYFLYDSNIIVEKVLPIDG